MPNYKAQIQASFLSNCPDGMAYDWLCNQWREPIPMYCSGGYWKADVDLDEREGLEAILLGRDSRLIDIGLAQFGYSIDAFRQLYLRGDLGVRCAIASNPRGFIFSDSILHTTDAELEALASNKYLDPSIYEDMILRKRYFSDLSDERWKVILVALGKNQRMSTHYKDGAILDGFGSYLYNKVFDAAWGLLETAPTTEEWAKVLYSFLLKTVRPYRSDKVEAWLRRWELPMEDVQVPPASFFLRSELISDLLEVNQELLNSNDAALRLSFFRRFAPRDCKDWPERVRSEKLSSLFSHAILENPKIWAIESERERLEDLFKRGECDDALHEAFQLHSYKFREARREEFLPQEARLHERLANIEAGLSEANQRLDSLCDGIYENRKAHSGLFGRFRSN